MLGVVLGVAPATALTASHAPLAPDPVLSRTALLDRVTTPDVPLVQYRARRHLEAATRGGRMRATLDAVTSLDNGRFAFDVESESGSSLIRSHVLRAALETEARNQTPDLRAQSAMSTDNYDFVAVERTAGEPRLDVVPRRRHEMLLRGSLFFDPQSGDLVRIEGEPSKRPSFWTRQVHIVREYQRIGGVRVPVAMRSTADVLMTGESTFAMTYEYATINGQPVAGR
jgi:hypothetical protein